jgi:signal-transduction protein with cAMP-binding, CBS, and nucleotidyltransferase domain
MRAIDTLRKRPVTIEARDTVTEAAALMDREAVGALVVTEAGATVGLVTDRDMVVRGMARRIDADARVDAVMTTEVATLPADADLRDALAVFRDRPVRRVVLVEGDAPVGVVSVDDLLVDLVGDLADLARPVTGQVLFGHPEPAPPATI